MSSVRVARGEEDHRHAVGAGAQLAQHLEAVHVGQHDVEQDQVRTVAAGAFTASTPEVAVLTAKPA